MKANTSIYKNLVPWMCCFLFLLSCKIFAQSPIDQIARTWGNYFNRFPKEKVYLHTDRLNYFSGDDLWFKMYVQPSNLTDTLSKVLYVRLRSDSDSLVFEQVYALDQGMASGDFAIPSDLKEGVYHLEASTHWMDQFNKTPAYHQYLRIWNSLEKNSDVFPVFRVKSKVGGDSIQAGLQWLSSWGNPLMEEAIQIQNFDAYNTQKPFWKKTDREGKLIFSYFLSEKDKRRQPGFFLRYKFDGLAQTQKLFWPVQNLETDLAFFPEGGNFVVGLPCKIAFKATLKNGKGTLVQGFVFDDLNQKVCPIQTSYQGMGVFKMVPQKGRSYVAKVESQDGGKFTFALPKAAENGLSMSVLPVGRDSILVRAFCSDSIFKVLAQKPLYLYGLQYERVKSIAYTPVKQPVLLFKLPLAAYNAGILSLVFHDSFGKILAERLFFKSIDTIPQVEIHTDKTVYAPRSPIWLEFDTKQANGKPMLGSFSVSVIDPQKFSNTDVQDQNIRSHFYLNAELKGNIEHPGSFFKGPDQERNLDLLMMVHGWRQWVDVGLHRGSLDSLKSPSMLPESGMRLEGYVTNVFGKRMSNAIVSMLCTKGAPLIKTTTTNAKGYFSFVNLTFKDSTELVLQARTQENQKNLSIEVLPSGLSNKYAFMPQYINNEIVQIWNEEKASIPQKKPAHRPRNAMREILLQEVEIKKRREIETPRDGLHSSADYFVKGENLQSPTGQVLDALNGRVAGVQITADPNSPGGYDVKIRGIGSIAGSTQPLYVIDGMQFDDASVLNTINVSQVEYIEVLKNASNTAVYGSKGANGVIVVKTKRGKYEAESTPSPGMKSITPPTFRQARNFYSPRYDLPQDQKSDTDPRVTLLWIPELLFSKDGKASVRFFNADNTIAPLVILQGLNQDGIPIYVEFNLPSL